MVPLEAKAINTMLHDVYRTLTEQAKAVEAESVEDAFIAWMNEQDPASATRALPTGFTVTNYHHVASLAFLLEINSANEQDWEELLRDGLNRVAGRPITFLETEPAPFRHDAIALLGLALGTKRVDGEIQAKVQQWMRSFMAPSDKTGIPWKRVFNLATLALAGEIVDQRDLQDLPQFSDLKLAFAAKGLDIFGDIDLDQAYQACCYGTMNQDTEPPIAACRLAALKYLTSRAPALSMNKPTVQQVVNLLERIPSALKRWPFEEKPKTATSTAQKWDLQNEYHVQSLVYSILAPIFPDIEDEFYFEPIGLLNPRADIGLPSLNLIIEIKFLRFNASFASMTEEIASDASLYFKKGSVFAKKYSQMLVLLWDNSSRNQNHHEFKKGIVTLPNVVGAVAVSRPGNMAVTYPAAQKAKPKRNQSKK
jgi:hypothetical protein